MLAVSSSHCEKLLLALIGVYKNKGPDLGSHQDNQAKRCYQAVTYANTDGRPLGLMRRKLQLYTLLSAHAFVIGMAMLKWHWILKIREDPTLLLLAADG